MKPFKLTDGAKNFNERFPTLDGLRSIYESGEYTETVGVCRAWITEGIPSAFSDTPLLFEKVREFIAQQIKVNPRDVTMVGSARTGFSLSPNKLGNEFSDESDLDLAVVSQDYFQRCEAQFLQFKDDFLARRVTPNNPNQSIWWPQIVEDIENQRTKRGFVDIWKIPTEPNYTTAIAAIEACWRAKEKLNATPFGPRVKDCSIRVFRDNHALIQQNSINLRSVLSI